MLGESAIAVRTKAMKCLSEVVAVDPGILARVNSLWSPCRRGSMGCISNHPLRCSQVDMQRGVHGRLMDNSTSVREAAVELLGRFVLSRPELIEQYYDMLIERILVISCSSFLTLYMSYVSASVFFKHFWMMIFLADSEDRFGPFDL